MFTYMALIVLLFSACAFIEAHFEYKNFKCVSYDKSFSEFEQCVLRSHNRTFKYLSLKAALHKKPVSNITVNIALMKNNNGYKPYYFNMTFDGCKFFNPKSNNIFHIQIQTIFNSYTNMNHSCPYDHDVEVKELPENFINNKIISLMPVPSGDYGLYLKFFVQKVLRADVRVYFHLSSDISFI